MAITRQISRNALILQNTDAEVAVSKTLTPYYEWVFNGQLNFPVETPLDTLHHLDAENTIHQVRITARKAGVSTYNFKLISYDVGGLNPVTHVNDNITFSSDRETYLIPVLDALIANDRIIEARVFESVVGATPAEDVTLTVTLGSFEELMPITNGHLIQRDDDTILPKREKLKFAGDVFTVSDDLPEDRTVVLLELPSSAKQQTVIVGSSTQVTDGIADFNSIQDAINTVSDGDKILILNGTYTENVTVSKKVSLFGEGNNTIINGTTTLQAVSSKSLYKYLKFNGNVVGEIGCNFNVITDCWLAPAVTINLDIPSENIVLVLEEL